MTTYDGDRFDDLLAAFLTARSEDVTGVRSADQMATAIGSHVHGRPDRRRVALAFAVVGLLVALLVAGLVGFGGQRQAPFISSDDAPVIPAASGAPSVVPPSLPADPNSFVSRTPVGTIRWTWTTTGVRLHPEGRIDGRMLAQGDAGEWYELSDGLAWRPTPSPSLLPSQVLSEADGLAFRSLSGIGTLMGPASFREVLRKTGEDDPEPPRLFRHVGSEWVEVPLPDTPAPATEGLQIHAARFEGAAAKGPDDWLIPVSRLVQVPWKTVLGLDADPITFWDGDATQIMGRERTFAIERAGGAGSTIEIRDASTRELVHEVRASYLDWPPDLLLDAVRRWGFEDTSFIVSRDGQLSVVRPPWPRDEEWMGGIEVTGGRYFTVTHVIGPDYAATAVHLWMSEDGISWRPVELPRMVSIGTLDYAELTGDADTILIRTSATAAGLWRSTDGLDWRPVDVEPGRIGPVMPFDGGWVMASDSAHALVSTNGLRWHDLPIPSPSADVGLTFAGGRFFYGPLIERGTTYGTWVGTFEPA